MAMVKLLYPEPEAPYLQLTLTHTQAAVVMACLGRTSPLNLVQKRDGDRPGALLGVTDSQIAGALSVIHSALGSVLGGV